MPSSGPTLASSPAAGRRLRATLSAVALAALASAALAGPANAATAKVPSDFFGVHLDGPALDGTAPLERELGRIRSSRTSTVRVGFFWNDAQPYQSAAEVPADQASRFVDVDGVPTDFTATDRIVGEAADAGLEVLPVVQGSPRWAADGGARTPNVPPRSTADYDRYLRALVARYGSDGTFWKGRKSSERDTIRGWQVWNEPSLTNHWTVQPFQKSYTALLKSAYRTIKDEDRDADVYLAGMTSASDVPAWTALKRVYGEGARRYFDVIAIHPYTKNPSGVMTVLERARREASRAGDARKPVALTEISWSSSNGDTPEKYATWDTTERTQARRVTQVMKALARRRTSSRIELASWYTWISPDVSKAPWPRYSGLSKMQDGKLVRKPAYDAYRRVVRDLRR